MPEERLMWQTQQCDSPVCIRREGDGTSTSQHVTHTRNTHTKKNKKLWPEEDMVIPHSQTWHTFLTETNGDHALEWISGTEKFFYSVQWQRYSYITTVVRYRVPHFPPDSCLKHNPVSSVPSWFPFKTSPCIFSSFLIPV